MLSWHHENLQMGVIHIGTSTFPCILLAECMQVERKDLDSPQCAIGIISTK